MNVIYAIKCDKTNKCYVGSTCQFSRRKSRHLRELNNNIHHSKKLQRAWNKHEQNSFYFEILESNVNNTDLLKKEENWINYMNSYEDGYNSYKTPFTSPKGELNGMFQKQPHNKGLASSKRRPIVSYDLNTGHVKYYDFSSQPMREEGLHPSYTSTFKKLLKSKGRLWFYLEDFNFSFFKEKYIRVIDKGISLRGKKRSLESRSNISKGKKNKKMSSEHIINLKLSLQNKKGKGIIRSDGKIYISISSAAKDLNVYSSEISRFLSRKRKSPIKGFTFNYE